MLPTSTALQRLFVCITAIWAFAVLGDPSTNLSSDDKIHGSQRNAHAAAATLAKVEHPGNENGEGKTLSPLRVPAIAKSIKDGAELRPRRVGKQAHADDDIEDGGKLYQSVRVTSWLFFFGKKTVAPDPL